MSGHTPGPWVAVPHDYEGPQIRRKKDKRCLIATMYSVRHAPTVAADARLIAAAPDMLAALEYMIRAFDEGHTTAAQCAALGEAKGAIAKAKGEHDMKQEETQ